MFDHFSSHVSDIKIPKGIPSRCEGLVKSYSNGELTFKDYMKQMGKCKRAEQVFNMMALGVTDKSKLSFYFEKYSSPPPVGLFLATKFS